MSDIITDGGVQLLSSTDSTYCPNQTLLRSDFDCKIKNSNRCLKFTDFFQLSSGDDDTIIWNPDIAILNNYHTTYKNKLLTRRYFDTYIPQGRLFYTMFASQKTFIQTPINMADSGSNSMDSSGMNLLATSNGKATINGSSLLVNNNIKNSGTILGIIIVIKNITLTNKSANTNKNLIHIYLPSLTGVDDLNNGIQIGFQPNNSFYFKNFSNNPWRSFYATEVPVIDDTSGFSVAFLFTGRRLISMFYAYNATTPSTILRNTYTTWASSIIGANPSTLYFYLGAKKDMEQPFQGSIGDMQIGFIHSWT